MSRYQNILAALFIAAVIVPLYFLLAPSDLEEIQKRGELVVATRNSATTYYEGPDGEPRGLEYELVSRYAKSLGVKVRFVVEDNLENLLEMVRDGEVDFAAAGLTVTDEGSKTLRFGLPYQQVTQQVIHRVYHGEPRNVGDLIGKSIEVVAGSSHVERLEALQQQYPDLEWIENTELSSEELLFLVWEKIIDYTVADSNEFLVNQRIYPELRVGFDLGEPEDLAWAFSTSGDDSLYNDSLRFIQGLRDSGELQRLLSLHYGYVEAFDYADTRSFMLNIYVRLPKYRAWFEKYAAEFGLDWRLLAAIGYQESHWQPHSRSPTGVRGIMMLTKDTAKQLGVEDRLDPEQSIRGGAMFFSQMLAKIPQDIPEPDRLWMALAAYNIGLGHLNDARIITEKQGENPHKWADVKKHLPLLSRQSWFTNLRHGYARGREPVRFVENVRSYYDLLVWILERDEPKKETPGALKIEPPAL
jgi:membrane-bound lytic murein transglycosylase F